MTLAEGRGHHSGEDHFLNHSLSHEGAASLIQLRTELGLVVCLIVYILGPWRYGLRAVRMSERAALSTSCWKLWPERMEVDTWLERAKADVKSGM